MSSKFVGVQRYPKTHSDDEAYFELRFQQMDGGVSVFIGDSDVAKLQKDISSIVGTWEPELPASSAETKPDADTIRRVENLEEFKDSAGEAFEEIGARLLSVHSKIMTEAGERARQISDALHAIAALREAVRADVSRLMAHMEEIRRDYATAKSVEELADVSSSTRTGLSNLIRQLNKPMKPKPKKKKPRKRGAK